MPFSYHHVQRAGENFERFAMKVQAFAVDHHVYRALQFERNLLDAGAESERVVDMRSGKKPWKRPEQSGAADGTPADVFNEAVGGIGIRRDHHFAARESAVAESQKQIAATIPVAGIFEPVRKRVMLEADDVAKDRKNISEFAPAFESPVRGFTHFGRKSKAQQIHKINFAGAVPQPDHIAGATAALAQGVNRVLHTVGREISEKGIP